MSFSCLTRSPSSDGSILSLTDSASDNEEVQQLKPVKSAKDFEASLDQDISGKSLSDRKKEGKIYPSIVDSEASKSQGQANTTKNTVKKTNIMVDKFSFEIHQALDSIGKISAPPKYIEFRKIWNQVATVAAKQCFREDGQVDIESVRILMDIFEDSNALFATPFSRIPCREFVREQILVILKHLTQPESEFSSLLNQANNITPGEHGKTILSIMSTNAGRQLNPGEAILASLFSPHRQFGLPLCTIHSLIISEKHNFPVRLTQIYMNIFEKDVFHTPSGYLVRQRPITTDGHIAIDLSKGGFLRDVVVGNIVSDQQKSDLQEAGIDYKEIEKSKLDIQVSNLDDVFFCNFLEETYGNSKNTWLGSEIHVYYGNDTHMLGRYSSTIDITKGPIEDGIKKLQDIAKEQPPGTHYMRVVTRYAGIDGGHAENLDVDRLIGFDLEKMKIGEVYWIGDRNWISSEDEDIPRLAIKKTSNKTCEFGTVYNFGTQREEFIKSNRDHTTFEIYSAKIAISSSKKTSTRLLGFLIDNSELTKLERFYNGSFQVGRPIGVNDVNNVRTLPIGGGFYQILRFEGMHPFEHPINSGKS